MRTLQKNSRSLFLSAALVASTFGFTADASAGWIAEGYADLLMTLASVSPTNDEGDGCSGNGNCNNGNGWSVSSTSSLDDSGADFIGSGLADFDNELFTDGRWTIGEEYNQWSNSYAEAGGAMGNVAGTASSFAETSFSITLQNNSGSGTGSGGQARTFVFDLESYVDAYVEEFLASTKGDSAAYGSIELFDDQNELFFSSAEAFAGGPLDDTDFLEPRLEFTVQPGQSYTFSGSVYSDASAVVVPVAPTFWLLGAGLLGLLHTQRRDSRTISATNLA